MDTLLPKHGSGLKFGINLGLLRKPYLRDSEAIDIEETVASCDLMFCRDLAWVVG